MLRTLTFFFSQLDVFHLVNAVVADARAFRRRRVVGDEVIVFVVPCQRPWADAVICAIMTVIPVDFIPACEIECPVEIQKSNFHAARHRAVQGVDIVVDLLINVFQSVADIDLALELPRFFPACKRLNLADQLAAFLFRDKP